MLIDRLKTKHSVIYSQANGMILPIIKGANPFLSFVFSDIDGKTHQHCVRLEWEDTSRILRYLVQDNEIHRRKYKPSSMMHYKAHVIARRDLRTISFNSWVQYNLWKRVMSQNTGQEEWSSILTDPIVFEFTFDIEEYMDLLTLINVYDRDTATLLLKRAEELKEDLIHDFGDEDEGYDEEDEYPCNDSHDFGDIDDPNYEEEVDPDDYPKNPDIDSMNIDEILTRIKEIEEVIGKIKDIEKKVNNINNVVDVRTDEIDDKVEILTNKVEEIKNTKLECDCCGGGSIELGDEIRPPEWPNIPDHDDNENIIIIDDDYGDEDNPREESSDNPIDDDYGYEDDLDNSGPSINEDVIDYDYGELLAELANLRRKLAVLQDKK